MLFVHKIFKYFIAYILKTEKEEFKKESLEYHYFNDGIKLENGDIFKCGKIIDTIASDKRLRLELVFKYKYDTLKIMIYESKLKIEDEQRRNWKKERLLQTAGMWTMNMLTEWTLQQTVA